MNLVTGATGHIGNVVIRELLIRGKKVRAFVLPGEDLSPLNGLDIEIVEGNVLDRPSLDRAMKGIRTVYHLAGMISIMPGEYEKMRRVNVDGTKNVLAATRKAQGKKAGLHLIHPCAEAYPRGQCYRRAGGFRSR